MGKLSIEENGGADQWKIPVADVSEKFFYLEFYKLREINIDIVI
jgi:hypothetical protein